MQLFQGALQMTPASGMLQSASNNPLSAGVCKLNWMATQRFVHGLEGNFAIHSELLIGLSEEQKWWLLSLRCPSFVPVVHNVESHNPLSTWFKS